MQDEFRLILQILQRAIAQGVTAEAEISFDYNYQNLFRPLKLGGKKRVSFERLPAATAYRLLLDRTHWCRRLSPLDKLRLKQLVQEPRGRRELKEYMHTIDGMLISLIFSVPELFLARKSVYELSDQICNSIMHHCLEGHYTNVLKDFKRIRKEVKYHAMTQTEYDIDYDYMRRYSWMVPFLTVFNTIRLRTSKAKMFRIAMFAQTRACGLASQQLCEEAVKEFIDTVTVKNEFNPNELLIECIEEVTSSLADKLNYGTNPMFKMSASTSACFESKRSDGGKFEQLKKEMIESGITAPEHLLYSTGGQIGTPMFQKAIEMAYWDEGIRKVNIAAVRENGKARVITSGSFWKDTLLQGFSHLTIEIVKSIRELEDSLQAARHGWKFISRLDYLDAEQCWPLFEEAFMYSFDWRQATDKPTHASGRATVGRLLQKLKIPDWLVELVLSVWVGMKELYYKGEFVGNLVNGIPMGDPLTKTNISLAHPIGKLYAQKMTASKVLGAGNGDDGIYIPTKREFAHYFNEAVSMLGYEVSPYDTFVTSDWGTYCEEYFYLPQDRFNTIKVGCRSNNTLAMPYLDFPKIRLILDTQKDREDHSSDIIGKVTLLGKDMEYVAGSKTGPELHIFCIAAAFQDVCLGIIQDDKPLYLPRQVNGVGRPPPFWSVESWMNILRKAKEWHRKYYLYAMRDYITGERIITGRKGILKESIHFSGEMRVETLEIPQSDPLKQEMELSVDQQKLFHPGIIQKLESLGYLVPESKIAKYYLFNKRLRQLDAQSTYVENDLFEVIKSDIIPLNLTDDEKSWRSIVRRFVAAYKDSAYSLKDDRAEPMYRSGTLDLLKQGDPLRIDLDLEVFEKFKERIPPNTPYRRNVRNLFDWYIANKEHILRGEMCPIPPTDVLADDPVIIRSLEERQDTRTFFFIVTDDVKLYKLAVNKLPRMLIGRIPIRVWFACGLSEETFHNRFEQQFPGHEMDIIIDQGSIESYIMLHNISFSQMGRWMLYDKTFDAGYRGIPWTRDLGRTTKVDKQPVITPLEREPATAEEAKFPWFGFTNPALLRNLRQPGVCDVQDRSRSQSREPENPVRRAH